MANPCDGVARAVPRLASSDCRVLLAASALIRLALLAFGSWQDAALAVRYTDIDYAVFSDAAAYLAAGGSPYQRATYRYSPLLAAVLVPNVRFPIWGKLLFCAADLLVGWLCYDFGRGVQCVGFATGGKGHYGPLCAAAWLFNPFTMAISTRGNGEALVLLMLLTQLRLLRTGRFALAGVIYGLAVHWRVYPAIYALSSVLSILSWSTPAAVLGRRVMVFGMSAGACFLLLGLGCYRLYGDEFLQHAVLYHASRLDHRHNFSALFYSIYLEWPAPPMAAKLALLPQAIANVSLAAAFHADLPFCWLLQTMAFVALNKVCTAQYFVWYFGLVPLCLPALLRGCTWRLGAALVAWLVTQLHWLGWAYQLEFQGQPVYFAVWLSSCLSLCGNAWLLVELMAAQRFERPKRD